MNWLVVYPEAVLLIAACAVALIDLFTHGAERRVVYWAAQIGMGVVAWMHWQAYASGGKVYGMQGLMVSDPMGHLLAFFAALAMIATVHYAQPYLRSRAMQKGEFYTLSMMVLLGICVMVSANHFLVVYLGLEVMSLSLYALVALRRDDALASEAAMKYFVLGALASGFLLYGLSMLYGATGSLDIPEVFATIGRGSVNGTVLTFGLVFVVAGLAFKLGVVPFHMWVPDVYQGAPTAITLMIGGAPKLAAFAITIRLLVEGLLALALDWQQMFVFLAVASLVIGNLAAIAQTNLKRLLAFSTISQMGFMLLGLTAGVVGNSTVTAGNAYSSAMFYVVSYVLTTLGTFGLILYLNRDGVEVESIADLAGLNQRAPWLALLMSFFMFSLAGVPPFVGFYAKLAIVQALVTTGQAGYVWLAVIAVLLSLIGAFYYLRIVKVMYFDAPTDTTRPVQSAGVSALLALNGALVLGYGVLPGGLMAVCRDAIVRALGT